MRKFGLIPGVATALAALVIVAAADVPQVQQGEGLPTGLASYLEARVFESSGRFREAMDAYERSLEEAPEINEIRLAYASFLLDVGMAPKAIDVLAGGEDMGPEGLKLRALALTQLSARDPNLIAETEVALKAAIEADDGNPNLLFALAQILQRQNKAAEAEEIVARLRQDRPDNPSLDALHADLLRSSGRLEEAAELYEGCAAPGPTQQACRQSLVEVLVELGRPGEAGELMLSWLGDMDLDSLMRAAVLLWEGGRLQRSLETVERVLVRAPDSVRAQTLEAHVLSSLGRFDEAVEKLKKLLKKNPGDLDLILAMAWAVGRTEDLDTARQWLDRAWHQLGDDTSSERAVRCATTAARLEIIADNPLVARGWLDRLGDLSAAGADYVRLLAETYRREEQWQEGITAMVRIEPSLDERPQIEAEAIESEFRLRTGDPRAWRRLRPLLDSDRLDVAMVGLQVLQTLERWQEVDQESAKAIERFGDERDLVFIRAAALERLAQFDAAAELFQKLVETEPDDANAANYLGYMWADRNVNLDEALQLISHAVALDPENSAFLDSLGWVHYRLGDFGEAEQWLRRAVDLGGDVGDGTVYCHLGEVLLVSGDRDDGRRFLLMGLDMGCEDPDHVRSLLEESNDEKP
jgi:tetratricopeptide (TPR) repeat protein